MNIIITNQYSSIGTKVSEPLFLKPDGTRTRFPIGWEGKGRYIPGTLKLYRASDNSPIDPDTYGEEPNGVFFNFTSAPTGNYNDILVKYFVRPEDYAFSQGTADSAYPDEEYFLFPNWRNAKTCGDAFWVGKYAASRADATTTSQGSSNTPVSKKGKPSWVVTRWDAQVASCLTKGHGFHCIRNREWVSIALWTEHMGIEVYGNVNGYNSNGSNIDMRGIGTDLTTAMRDTTAPRETTRLSYKMLTGMGPDSFRHNGKSGGISDLAGNVWEAVDGLRLVNGVPYIYDDSCTSLVALAASAISSSTTNPMTINYINNSSDDLINEGLPVNSAGMAINVSKDGFWQTRTDTRICYRGGGCNGGSGAGVWALGLDSDVSTSAWSTGFRLARSIN